MRKFITTRHSEFAQNGENMALVKTKMPGSKPIMISTSTFMEALKNSNEEITEMLGLQSDEYYIKPIVQTGDTISTIILKMPPITITSYEELFSTKGDSAAESLINSVTTWNDGSLYRLCYDNSIITSLSLDSNRVNINVVDSLNQAFYECNSLKYLDISGIHTPGTFTANGIFAYCSSLEFLDMRNIDWTKCTPPAGFANMIHGSPFGNIPKDCKVIVGTEADRETLLTTSMFAASGLTNIMTVAEYEASLEV